MPKANKREMTKIFASLPLMCNFLNMFPNTSSIFLKKNPIEEAVRKNQDYCC